MFRKCLVLSVLLAGLLLTACSNGMGAEGKLNRGLVENGIQLTQKSKMLAEHHEFYGAIDSYYDVQPFLMEMADYEYGIPEEVYKLNLTDELLRGITLDSYEVDEIPEGLFSLFKDNIQSYHFAIQINMDEEYDLYTASQYVGSGESYLEPKGWKNNVLLLLRYPGEYSSVVSFVHSGEGIIAGTAYFVKNSEKDMREVLEDAFGISASQFERIDSSELKALSKS